MKWRVHFRIDLPSYRDVEADSREEAYDLVNGEWYDQNDIEAAGQGNISVDDVEALRPPIKRKARK